VDAHTLFAIASNSKAFTAAALAMMVDEGKLSWDEKVSTYLPWFSLKDPFASQDIRVRDLLCHRSGLGTFSGDLLWWGTPYTAREVLERATLLDPAAPFRTKYAYSNLMFIAAGEVLKAVSGLSWHDFMLQRIFDPLVMERSVVSTSALSAVPNVASPHKTLPDMRSLPIPWMNWDAMGAAGGIISSAHDMGRWMQTQLQNGIIRDTLKLFSASQSREMWQAHTSIPVSEGSLRRFPSTHFRAYGLGWSLSDYLGYKIVGHGGGYDGMYSQVAMIPEKKLGIAVLTNSMTGIASAITYRIMDAFVGAPERDWSAENLPGFQRSLEGFQKRIQDQITPTAKGTSHSHPAADYVGTYTCPMYGDARVELDNGKLVIRLLPFSDLVADLEHLHYDTFVVKWRKTFAWFGEGTAHFVADAKGRFTKLELDIPNDDLWFYELKFAR
jgi:CubicO group peptidase (beta-lactamase class C family)